MTDNQETHVTDAVKSGEVTQPNNGEEKQYSQNELNNIIGTRLIREREKLQKDIDSKIQSAIEDWKTQNGIDETTLEKISQVETTESKINRFKLEASNYQKQIESLSKEKESISSKLHKQITKGAVFNAASKLTRDPDTVWLHLKDSLTVDDELNVYVKKDEDLKTIEETIQTLLEDKPFLAKPTGYPGGGSTPYKSYETNKIDNKFESADKRVEALKEAVEKGIL